MGQSLSLQGSCLQGVPLAAPGSGSGLGFPFCLDHLHAVPACVRTDLGGDRQRWKGRLLGEAAESVLELGRGYMRTGPGDWRCGGTQVGARKVDCSSLGLQRPSAVTDGRDVPGPGGAAWQNVAEDTRAP